MDYYIVFVTIVVSTLPFSDCVPTRPTPNAAEYLENGNIMALIQSLNLKIEEQGAQLNALYSRLSASEESNARMKTELDNEIQERQRLQLKFEKLVTIHTDYFEELEDETKLKGNSKGFGKTMYNCTSPTGSIDDSTYEQETPRTKSHNDERPIKSDHSNLSKEKEIQVPMTVREKRQIDHVAFTAYLDHDVSHIGVGQVIKFNRLLSNEGTGYNVHTGVFTAPISGTYFFTFTIHIHSGESHGRLVIDGENVVDAIVNDRGSGNEIDMGSNSAVISVDAGQSVWIEQYHDTDVALVSREDYRFVTFTGFLLH